MLYVTDMAFKGRYDADPLARSVLVLQDKRRSHFVDATHVWVLPVYNFFFLNYYVCITFVLIYWIFFFLYIICSLLRYSLVDNRC